MRVKPLLFDGPCRCGIATNAKARRSRRYHYVGPGWMRAYLMDIFFDINCGLPGSAGIG